MTDDAGRRYGLWRESSLTHLDFATIEAAILLTVPDKR
jgi:hypothetical protein